MVDINTIKYESKFVAFLDILGYKKMIEKDKDSSIEIIYKIEKALSRSLEMLKYDFEDKISIKMFSDCFCISFDNKPEILKYILRELALMQLLLSFERIFVRGGLSKGLHYESDRIIFSKGLVDAYKFEKSAVYPRIIIDEAIFADSGVESIFSCDHIIKDPDPSFFIDYMDFDAVPHNLINPDDYFESHKRAILYEVKENIGNAHVLKKYKWLAEYHNSKFDKKYRDNNYSKKERIESSNALKIDVQSVFPVFSKS